MLASGLECVEIMEQIDADLKMAERYLLHYEKELAEYEAAKAAFMAGQQGQCGGRGNLPGKPVEAQAIRGVEFDNSYVGYPWLKAVEIVQRSLGERKNIFIQVRREAEKKKLTTEKGGRPAYLHAHQSRRGDDHHDRHLRVRDAYDPVGGRRADRRHEI